MNSPLELMWEHLKYSLIKKEKDMKKARIIATLGPASSDPSMIEALVNAGVNICRINFSFGKYEEHQELIDNIRKVCKKTGKAIAIMQAIQGPKIRMGQLNGPVKVKEGQKIVLSGGKEHKEEFYFPTTYEDIASDTEPGKEILLADGKIILDVEEVYPKKKEVHCVVTCGGTILTGKGINLPYTNISLPALTKKDIDDVIFGARAGVDYMSLSFVRSAVDVVKLRQLLEREEADIPIIAKIEKPEAVDCIDDILDVADGVMIARGDLAVEVSYEKVPVMQKEIVEKANQKGKITIIATEMLGSMVTEPLPSRAEASDVANAILDGTDCVMLSNETAMGDHPVKAVEVMNGIVVEAEKLLACAKPFTDLDLPLDVHDLTKATCASATRLAYEFKGNGALIVVTRTGRSVKILSKNRPNTPIYAITDDQRMYQRLAFLHNVYPMFIKNDDVTEQDIDAGSKAFEFFEKKLVSGGFLKKGDRLIYILGDLEIEGRRVTNTIKVRTIQ